MARRTAGIDRADSDVGRHWQRSGGTRRKQHAGSARR
jgi:hypothetical protein